MPELPDIGFIDSCDDTLVPWGSFTLYGEMKQAYVVYLLNSCKIIGDVGGEKLLPVVWHYDIWRTRLCLKLLNKVVCGKYGPYGFKADSKNICYSCRLHDRCNFYNGPIENLIIDNGYQKSYNPDKNEHLGE